MRKTLVYCGDIKDTKIFRDYFSEIIHIDHQEDIKGYCRSLKDKERNSFNNFIYNYDGFLVDKFDPLLSKINSDEIVFAGNLLYYAAHVASRMIYIMYENTKSFVLVPSKLENSNMYWLSQGLLEYHKKYYKKLYIYDSEEMKGKTFTQIYLDKYFEKRNRKFLAMIKKTLKK